MVQNSIEYKRYRRTLMKSRGICTTCQCRKPRKGKIICEVCMVKYSMRPRPNRKVTDARYRAKNKERIFIRDKIRRSTPEYLARKRARYHLNKKPSTPEELAKRRLKYHLKKLEAQNETKT